MVNIIIVLSINFLIGAIGLFVFIQKKNIDSKSHRTKKYFSYLIIVSLLLACIHYSGMYLPFIFGVIVLIGAYEIFRIAKNNKSILILSLLLFLAEGFFFVKFATVRLKLLPGYIHLLLLLMDIARYADSYSGETFWSQK